MKLVVCDDHALILDARSRTMYGPTNGMKATPESGTLLLLPTM